MSITLLITSGDGPVETQQAVAHALERLLEEAGARGLDADISETPGRHGPKSAIVRLHGGGAEALAARWLGTVKWVFKSRLRPGHKRQNWFIGVFRLPDPPVMAGDAGDIRFETFRAGGPGGQHQNTTDSAVRATCTVTGLSVVARDGRSQHRNKAEALRRLAELKASHATLDAAHQRRDANLLHHRLERCNPVRVFKGDGFREVRK
ncbi:MAG: peptide chain release factor H [Gammaproteobacteria bacterium]|nr:peptide chain release factor H [Gammaproteobacteria bacterium]